MALEGIYHYAAVYETTFWIVRINEIDDFTAKDNTMNLIFTKMIHSWEKNNEILESFLNIFFISSHPANVKQEKMFDAVLASNKTKILIK